MCIVTCDSLYAGFSRGWCCSNSVGKLENDPHSLVIVMSLLLIRNRCLLL